MQYVPLDVIQWKQKWAVEDLSVSNDANYFHAW